MPDPHVVSIPMRTRFRGIEVREAVLLEGPAGWGEFSPFWDYGIEECRAWWAAAHEAMTVGFPAPVRDQIPVNVTVPAVDGERAAAIVSNSSGCRTAKVKVAEPGQSEADDVERLEAVRDALLNLLQSLPVRFPFSLIPTPSSIPIGIRLAVPKCKFPLVFLR